MDLAKKNLTSSMLFSLFFGIIFGFVLKLNISLEFINFINFDLNILKKIGIIFVNLLKMISAPFIFSSMSVAIFSLTESSKVNVKSLTIKTIIVFFVMTVISAGVGMSVAVFLKPGNNASISLIENLNNIKKSSNVSTFEKKYISDMIFDIIPNNLFDSFLKSNFIQIIFFSFIFSVAVTKIPDPDVSRRIKKAVSGFNALILEMVKIIMKLAPICTFFMISWLIATQDVSLIKSLLKLIMSSFFAAFVILIPLYGLSSLFILKLNPFTLFKKLIPVQILSFLTASSASSLPLGMKIAEHDLGVPNDKVKFIIPFGTAINMNGGVMYFTLVTIFISQIFQQTFGISDYILLFVLSILMAAGTAPIPGSGIFLLTNLLITLNLPLEAVTLIIGIDRILDMIRTCVNVSGDVYSSVIISRLLKTLDKKIYDQKNNTIS